MKSLPANNLEEDSSPTLHPRELCRSNEEQPMAQLFAAARDRRPPGQERPDSQTDPLHSVEIVKLFKYGFQPPNSEIFSASRTATSSQRKPFATRPSLK